MKKKHNIRFLLSKTFLPLAAGLLFNTATAQTDAADQEKKESSIDLSFYKNADLSKTITAMVTTMGKENKWIPAGNVDINFYTQSKAGPAILKSVLTDYKGIASLPFSESLSKNENGVYKIIARIENNGLYNDAEEQIEFKEANLSMKFNPDDSTHEVSALVTETGVDGNEIPVAETEVSFFVQRLFGTMPASEEFVVNTDNNGEAVFSFPEDIMGGRTGNITLIAKVVNNKLFGTVETKSEAPWGKIVPVEANPFPRSLSNPKAPLQLIITLVAIFGGIWTTYFFIFYQLKKINEEKKINLGNEINQQ